MRKKNKTTKLILRLLVFAMVVSLTASAVPVSAAESDGTGMSKNPEAIFNSLDKSEKYASDPDTPVHKNPAVFEKNFCLTPAQKEYTITKIQDVVSKLIRPKMSDLEKYYTLAVWENKRAVYDYRFWMGGYDFNYYRHQWDSYGVLTEKSVCVGTAITYSVLCHAADLPCKFVRCDPEQECPLDHTISYVPDINDNAYYLDVTENSFLMSKDSDASFEPIDRKFSEITKECEDGSFEYYETYSDDEFPELNMTFRMPTNLKECFKKPYAEWFKEYALHQGTDKEFVKDYEEKGSGLPLYDRDSYHASYKDFEKYPPQPYASRTSNATGIWFLDDFYKEPAKARETILNKEFDEQFLDIRGLDDIYDCEDAEALVGEISTDIVARYFPSSVNKKVVAWSDDLKNGMDYELECTDFNSSKGTAVVAIKAAGDYKGTYPINVKIKADNPMKLKGKVTTLKHSKLKKKAQTINRAKVIKVSNAEGALSYKLVSAKKGKKKFTKKFKVDAKTGNVKVKKKLKRGTYKVKVNVNAAGNSRYKESPLKQVTFKVKVK